MNKYNMKHSRLTSGELFSNEQRAVGFGSSQLGLGLGMLDLGRGRGEIYGGSSDEKGLEGYAMGLGLTLGGLDEGRGSSFQDYEPSSSTWTFL